MRFAPDLRMVLGIAATVAIALWTTVYCWRTSGVFDSSWNYKRHGPFQVSTPTMAPDGRLIVFDTARTGNGDIYSLRLDETNVQILVSTAAIESHPVFSWDGKAIAFARQTGGYQHVWLFHLDDKTETQLTTGRVIDLPVASSPNGFIYRRSTFSGRALLPKRELFEITLSGFRGTTVQRFGEVESVSPDGQQNIRKIKDAKNGREELWVTSRVSSTTIRIGVGWAPSFSRDGRRIVYLQRQGDYADRILMTSVEGEERVEICTAQQGLLAPTFCLRDTAIMFRTLATEKNAVGGIHLYRSSESNITEILIGW